MFSSIVKSQTNQTAMFSKVEIVSNLDSLHPYKSLPSFDLETQSFVKGKIHLYADKERWAIVLEEVKPNQGGDIVLYSFGNCLINQEKGGLYGQYLSNMTFLRLISIEEFKRINDGTYHTLISPKIKKVQIKGQQIPIEHDLNVYKKKNIPVIDYLNPKKQVDYIAMLRYLDEVHPELLSASEEELKGLLPSNLPKLLQIDSFHFKDFSLWPAADGADGEHGHKPSSYETFQLIAEVLITKDTGKWKPTLTANNHWRHNTKCYNI